MNKIIILTSAIACAEMGYATEQSIEKITLNASENPTGNQYLKMEWDTTNNDKMILKQVSVIEMPESKTKIDLIIPGVINGRRIEVRGYSERNGAVFEDLSFASLDADNVSLNIKFQEENGSKVLFPENCFKMFANSSALKSIDLSGADTSNVTDMGDMFGYCEGLTFLDVSKFKTSNVTDMCCMFNNCTSLTSLEGVDKFDTSNVTDMGWMFQGCKSLISLDVSKFKTSNVTDMSCMFKNCYSLTFLDVSRFYTDKVMEMNFMFYKCNGLISLNLNKFVLPENSRWMTDNCISLLYPPAHCRCI